MRSPLIPFACVLIFAALFVKADVFAQLTKLNVGYVGVTSDNAAAFIALETGIYTRNGLNVQLIYFNSGSTAVTALIADVSSADARLQYAGRHRCARFALSGKRRCHDAKVYS